MYVVDAWDRKVDVGSAKAQDRQKGSGHGDLKRPAQKGVLSNSKFVQQPAHRAEKRLGHYAFDRHGWNRA